MTPIRTRSIRKPAWNSRCSSDGFVKIEIFNSVGQVVASMVDQDLSAGAYTATWDALDSSGNQVSSGVYFYRMEAGEFTATRSMTLLK